MVNLQYAIHHTSRRKLFKYWKQLFPETATDDMFDIIKRLLRFIKKKKFEIARLDSQFDILRVYNGTDGIGIISKGQEYAYGPDIDFKRDMSLNIDEALKECSRELIVTQYLYEITFYGLPEDFVYRYLPDYKCDVEDDKCLIHEHAVNQIFEEI